MTTRTAKKPHHEDVLFAGMAARATSFTAFLHLGPANRVRATASSFDEAVDEAKRLERENPGSARRAMVYAIGPRNESINVDANIATLAGFSPETIARLGVRA